MVGSPTSPLAAKALLLDMDGVLYVGGELIPGAVETVECLRAAGVPFRFITNTTTRTPESLLEKLAGFGLEVETAELFTAVSATLGYLRRKGRPSVHLLVRDAIRPLFAEFPEDGERPDFVVIGDIGARWDYETLNRVFNLLMQGTKLVSMHRNKFFQEPEGLRMDIGAFVAAFEYVADVSATVVGKPSAAFFREAVRALGCDPEEVAIVGDDIDSDIGGGQDSGLRGVLVETGKYRADYCRRSSINPDRRIPSIADLPALL
ncbi:MAG: TIGR01458 family HAD-type hydrolase, partial [Verrucomicrobiota bacterium]